MKSKHDILVEKFYEEPGYSMRLMMNSMDLLYENVWFTVEKDIIIANNLTSDFFTGGTLVIPEWVDKFPFDLTVDKIETRKLKSLNTGKLHVLDLESLETILSQYDLSEFEELTTCLRLNYLYKLTGYIRGLSREDRIRIHYNNISREGVEYVIQSACDTRIEYYMLGGNVKVTFLNFMTIIHVSDIGYLKYIGSKKTNSGNLYNVTVEEFKLGDCLEKKHTSEFGVLDMYYSSIFTPLMKKITGEDSGEYGYVPLLIPELMVNTSIITINFNINEDYNGVVEDGSLCKALSLLLGKNTSYKIGNFTGKGSLVSVSGKVTLLGEFYTYIPYALAKDLFDSVII